MNRLVVFAFLFAQAGVPLLELPQLRIEAPPQLAAFRTRLESIDQGRIAGITQLVGITDVGQPIQVVLAPESSDLARGVPSWISGFAVTASDLVVIFPARSPTYPNDTLEDILRHEVAHVLIWRASGGHPIPRWFNEGLAMEAERERRFADQTQLFYQLVTGHRTTLDELDRLFSGNETNQTRAYTLAGALVHDVMRRHGSTACSEILMRIRHGVPFDAAFADVTGLTPAESESEFWRRERIWTAWVPIITASTTVWIGVTMLAILAIYKRRQRNRAIEEQWAKEEEDES